MHFYFTLCSYEIIDNKGTDHVCFDTWWLSLLLRMHEHAPLIFPLFFWPHPSPSCSQLPRTNQSSRFSCNVTASGKPLSPNSEMYLFSSRVPWQTLLQSLLEALITCTQHILHVHPFQGCGFPKHRGHGMVYTASWDVFWLSGFKHQLRHLLPVHVRKVFKFYFPICRMERDVISTSQDK